MSSPDLASHSEAAPPCADGRYLTKLLVGTGVAQFCVFTALMAPALSAVAVRIAELAPHSRNASLSLVLGAGAMVAMVAYPLLGALSDRTRTRFGRRKPWIAAGALGGMLGLVVLGLAPSVPIVLLGWCLCQFLFNAAVAGLQTMIPDQVPPHKRGQFSAVLGVAQYAALMFATFLVGMLATHTLLMFAVPGLVGLLGVAALLIVAADRDSTGDPVEPFSPARFVTAFWVSPRAYPDFTWAWVSRFFKVLAMFTLTSYQTYFFIDRYGFSPATAARYVFVANVVSTGALAIGNAVCGWLSDRIGRRKPFVIGAAVLLGIGLLLLTIAVPFGILLCFIALIGMGQGVYAGVDFALVVDILPRKTEYARDLGMMNIAGTLPQSFAPAVAPLLLAIGGSGHNYDALFIAGAVSAAIGAFTITFVKGTR